ncbi:SulP family inorganic anion transporter [Gluconobacter kanchanaburiensis]|uniref:Sodium-independent anion transporter n=1 Tax=Gluconobacter kanchanaburiensis NBRC 103587 TaxID=1307948 RepID=A0A511BBH0_9PROT|nr:SulP family inorganic anion transporter [Gluconobacter kanchanaburiensis]MBF0862847.1 SulP family inorganic anion transporter [Gluconobacter kanchanaburiensis]GBR70480.1 sulfate permease [Gluconobacter kanchanaburiensis NBRC 103587]GEK97132.1 sodium-independent anion transporter [Gluconobacter kanchanaburiensis NBRC 103587]
MTPALYRRQWAQNPLREVLAGMVGTFALIPEVIAFSYIAGVSPAVSLFASFVISVSIAIFGGRPGMISGAAGSVALVAAPLVHAHGVQAMLLATLVAGALQVLFGVLRLQAVMRFVSAEVRTGFVNALAIMIFAAQVPQILGVTWHTYALIVLGLVIIYLLPRLSDAIPSPLICIVVLTAITMLHPMPVHTVADLGDLPTGLPSLTFPHIPLTWTTWSVVLPYALAMAAVGLLESMMTASVVDDITDTHGDQRMECTGLGISNILVGAFGGIAGCGMIGQTVGNLRYGGRGRLSTFTAGAFLLALMVLLHRWVGQVPMAALVAIMIMVSASTFSWSSLRDLARHPRLSSLTMIITVAVVVVTHDLAAGVAVGVMLSGVFFAWQASKLLHVTEQPAGDTLTYTVTGQVLFASASNLSDAIDYHTQAETVVLDLSHARFWDITAVQELEKIIGKLRSHGHDVKVTGLRSDLHDIINRQSDETLLAL